MTNLKRWHDEVAARLIAARPSAAKPSQAERAFSRNCATVAVNSAVAISRTAWLTGGDFHVASNCVARAGRAGGCLPGWRAAASPAVAPSRPNRASPSSSATRATRRARCRPRSTTPVSSPKRCAASALRSSKAPTLSQADLVRTYREFLAKVEAGGPDTLAFVYFSGHALSFEGENYLLGVDARLARDSDIPIEGVRLSDLLRPLADSPARAKVVMIDATRPLPFRPQGRGLARGLEAIDRRRACWSPTRRRPARSRRTGRAPTAPMRPRSPRCCARRASTSKRRSRTSAAAPI